MNSWQPIETAPKDERAILVYCPAKIVTIITAAFWHRDYNRWQLAFTGLSKEPTVIEPTHWMPLPDPPAV
jgi:hypothetical protein